MKFHFSLWCSPWFFAQCSESSVLHGEKLPSSAVRNEIQGGGFPTRAATSTGSGQLPTFLTEHTGHLFLGGKEENPLHERKQWCSRFFSRSHTVFS